MMRKTLRTKVVIFLLLSVIIHGQVYEGKLQGSTIGNKQSTPQKVVKSLNYPVHCCSIEAEPVSCPTTENNAANHQCNSLTRNLIKDVMKTTDHSTTFHAKGIAMTVLIVNNYTKSHVSIIAPKLSLDTEEIQMWIPMEAFKDVSEKDPKKIGIVTYDSYKNFNVENVSMKCNIFNNVKIMSKIIEIEVFGQDSVNLTDPLKIFFPVNNYTNHSTKQYIYSCQYLKDNRTWKPDGCNTTLISDDMVECTCNHMTPFAVLLVDRNPTDVRQWKILSYISYVGCTVSAFFTASTVLSFICNRNKRAEVSSSIHVSLSGALFLLNMSFMLSEWGATLNVTGACVFIAVTIHYSLLSSFTWMAVEALHLYLLLIRVFNIDVRHYMAKLSVIGWGVPAVVVGSLLSIPHQTPYGTNEVKFLNLNATSTFCWITEPNILYGVNICYFSVVFLFNTLVLITVSRQIFMLTKVAKKIPLKDVSTVLGLMCLMGTSWGLVFLTSGYTNYPILYMFCISNTLQGFFIFLWMCRTGRPEKKKAVHTKSLSTVTDTLTTEKTKSAA